MTRLSLIATLAWVLPGAALAHHDGAIGRIDPTSAQLVTPGRGEAPRLDSSLAYRFAYFGRVLDDGSTVDGDGAIEVHLAVLGARVYATDSVFFSAALPVGLSRTEGERFDEQTRGLGDMTLGVGYATQWSRVLLSAEAGMVLPSGRYEPENALTISDITTTAEGGLDLALFDTRASLGADTWAAQAAVTAALPLGPWIPRARLSAVQPLTDTEDGIRWGTDLSAAADLAWTGGPVTLSGGAEWRSHLEDRLQVGSDDAPLERLGGRDQLSVLAEISVATGEDARCGIAGSVPVYQRTGAPQVVETFSGSLQCAFALGL
ncbi:MAG: transporter [Myxococcota bacterium]